MASEIVIVVAESEAGLRAIEASENLDLIDGTISSFEGVETMTTPGMTSVGMVNSGKSGVIALARLA